MSTDGAFVLSTQNSHSGGTLIANRMVAIPYRIYIHVFEANNTRVFVETIIIVIGRHPRNKELYNNC